MTLTKLQYRISGSRIVSRDVVSERVALVISGRFWPEHEVAATGNLTMESSLKGAMVSSGMD